jgi:non-specific serine/threonine protein kinase
MTTPIARRRPLTHLPEQLTRFIGREDEIADVKRLVASTRLLTLTGPGGCGKTRLAIAVADRLATSPTFEHGAWFIGLAGLDDPLAIPQTVAEVIGVPEATDQPLLESLADFLQRKRCLLILDNCEHLLSACAEVAQTLLEVCPHLHILATSREPLNLPGETVWLVPSLSLPDSPHPPLLERLAESEAIQLFVARAGAALPGFALNEANAATVEQICRGLDGIPLAIELAAARVKLLDVAQIAARLDDTLQLLTRGSRAAAPRHQTMRAALDWSFHLLSPREQALFQRLAVFAGGFTLETVEAVCADESAGRPPDTETLSVSDVLDVLADLVDKSLALTEERTAGEAVRYRLLEPIRQYALDRLRKAGAEAAARDRHLACFIDLAERAEPKLKGEAQLLWLRRLDKEHDNLRAALAWSARDPSRAVAGLRLAKALHYFWHLRGYWSEGRRWLEGAIANYDAHADVQSKSSDLILARAIVAHAWLVYYQRDYGGMGGLLERGLALARTLDDPVTVAYALGLQAALVSYAGDNTAAHRLSEASLASARRSGDRWVIAWAGRVHGTLLYYEGEEAAAQAVLEESRTLFREAGDQRSIAAHANQMGIITANAGALDAARGLFEEALAIGTALDDKELQISVSSNLANLAQLQGDAARAAEVHEQLLTQARELGLKREIAVNLLALGHIRIDQGDLDTAGQLLSESLSLAWEISDQSTAVAASAGLGRIAASKGKTPQAARVLGAVDACLTANAIRLDADVRALLERDEAGVRAGMTPEEFEAAFAAGQALTLEQAVQEATSAAWESKGKVQPAVSAAQTLRLRALGPARVFLGEQPVTTWPYARVKELLFYLVSHPARSKAQIGLALWPDASPAQLRNSLGTTLYHLRRALGDSQWIVFEEELYRFNRALNYRFDVETFESNLAQAVRLQAHTPERAIALLQEAIELYRGDFVEEYVAGEWFLLRREELRRKYLDGLLRLGQLLFAQGDYARAAEAYRRAVDKDEVLEEAHRELMRCYARLGERGQALRHYQTLAQLMQDALGSPPAPESAALYERLRRGDEV